MKGDVVKVVLITGQELDITASKRGRSVGVTSEYQAKRGRWLIIQELAAQSRRPVGSSLEVRQDQVAAIRKLQAEP